MEQGLNTHLRLTREVAFAEAQRHSRAVKWLRIVVPAAGALSLLLVFGASWFNASLDVPVSVEKISISDGKLIMDNARMTGFRSDSSAYEVVARTATQALTDPDIVYLTEVDGSLSSDGSRMSANQGRYNGKRDLLYLQGDVVLTSARGYRLFLDRADVDLKEGRLVSYAPVHVKMVNSDIRARALQVEQGGDLIRFIGQVSMHFIPQKATVKTPD